jgi:hypothetical protein
MNRAHGLRTQHAIFTTPLAVDTTLETRDDDVAAGYAGGTWLVHSGEYPEVDVGMVSDGNGFEDSPDCERIAGGVNSKGPRAVAIGRQANLLQWGFYGAPDRMTAPAKRAFLNAIVWMKQFRGHRPVATKVTRSREWMGQFVDMLEQLTPEQRASAEKNSLAAYVRKQFPESVVAGELDVGKLRQWLRDHEGYLHCAGRGGKFAVDEDLVAIGIGNRDPRLLDWLLEALAKDPQHERALRVAQRYLGEHGKDAATVRAFVEGNRGRLFFSDTGGFRWLAAPPGTAPAKPGAASAGKER